MYKCMCVCIYIIESLSNFTYFCNNLSSFLYVSNNFEFNKQLMIIEQIIKILYDFCNCTSFINF